MYKKMLSSAILLLAVTIGFSQSINQIINATEVERIEKVLSADDMQGRRVFTPGIDKAADFIADEFKKAGLKPWKGSSYFQDFALLARNFVAASGQLNGQPINDRNIVAISTQPELSITESAGYQKIIVGPRDTLYPLVTRLLSTKGNYFLVIDTAQARLFNSLRRFRTQSFPFDANIVAVL